MVAAITVTRECKFAANRSQFVNKKSFDKGLDISSFKNVTLIATNNIPISIFNLVSLAKRKQ